MRLDAAGAAPPAHDRAGRRGATGRNRRSLPVTAARHTGDASLPVTETKRRAYDLRAEAFGPGFNGPLTVVIDAREAAVGSVADSIRSTSGVVSVSKATFNQQGDTAILTAVPSTAPTDERTENLVETLRAARPSVEAAGDVTYEITGTTALDIDMARKTKSALVPYVAIVIGLAVLLLLVVFRPVWVPVGLGSGQGGTRILAVAVRRARRDRRGVPMGLGRRPARRRTDRAGHEPDADPAGGHRVRPGYGLSGLPGLADA
ncbi:hypothetical protein [Actinoplanes sp. NPDC048796]|uniref:hypothetical protein n=1 Tax=Actinoplanes sp. NPDC048796 TaxID=3155640 RepID=UPI0033F9CEDF